MTWFLTFLFFLVAFLTVVLVGEAGKARNWLDSLVALVFGAGFALLALWMFHLTVIASLV